MATQKTEAKEALRGEERIQQLMEEFPEIPRVLVIKADAIQLGMKRSAGSRLAGRWALPDAHWYFEYDREDSHTAEEAAEGYTLSPVICHLSNGVNLQPMFDSRSPYEIRYEERGRYRLYRDDQPMEEVTFPPRPQWYDRKTSSGTPMSSVMALKREGQIKLVPLTYCEYGKDNLTCKYCNINPSESIKKGLGMERVTAKREQDIYETYVAASQEGLPRHTSISVSGGVILDSSKEAEVYARVVKTLRRAMQDVGIEFPISVTCQALKAEDQTMQKEAGASGLGHNMEVWDPRMFEIICPGKAKYVGREKWIEAILRAKDIFGSTGSSFVLGVEMAPPHGFKTEDEAAASVLEGWEWLMARGVSPAGSPWRCVPGTEFAGMPSPRTEYVLRMSLAHYKLAVKYNQVGKGPGVGQAIFGDEHLIGAHIDRPGKS